jgi:hypothetical protein
LKTMRYAFTLMLCAASMARAQDAFIDAWNAERSRNPAGLEFTLATPKASYYMGEAIVVTFQLRSAEANTFEWNDPTIGRMGIGTMFTSFTADPSARVEDPQAPRPAGAVISGPSGTAVLSKDWLRTERVLNESLRFKEPGIYRIYGRTWVRHLMGKPDVSSAPVSDVLTIEIRQPPVGWAAQQIAAAKKVFAEPVPRYQDPSKQYVEALRTLAFLDTAESEVELLHHLSDERARPSGMGYSWVPLSRDRPRTLAAMEALLIAPDLAVSGQFLSTLRKVSSLNKAGAQPDYASRLAASLDSKRPEARAVTLATLLTDAGNVKPAPVWMPLVTGGLAENFHALPVFAQRDLLAYYWEVLKGPAMLPILRSLYANPPKQASDPAVEDLALKRLFELAPEEAGRLLLAEIRQRTSKRLSWETLAKLPNATLPDLDEEFARGLELRSIDERMILRYATGDIVSRVKTAYLAHNAELDRQQFRHCGSPLVPYFLKYDPAFGEQEIRRSIGLCASVGFRPAELGAYVMSPALEKLAVEFLMNSPVRVKAESAEMLGKYGSAAARESLWSTMEYFHKWWDGRETELARNLEGVELERALRTALAKPGAGTVSQRDLERLLSLCSSGQCTGDVSEWMRRQ